MKFRELSVALVGLLICAAPLLADDGGKPGRTTKEKTPCSNTATVTPGSSATNGDGVQVTNNGPSQGDCNLTPSGGGANCSTFANAKAGFQGKITGMDANDMTSLAGPSGSGSVVVSGTGGTVTIGPGNNCLVVNTNPAGSLGGNITVHAPGGPYTIGPGQSKSFHT